MNRLLIDIYSDIACPWCFIGTRRLRDELDALPDDVDVSVRHHTYLLQPNVPREGIDLPTMLRDRYGADPLPMFSRVETVAKDAGIPLDFRNQTRIYDTSAAHTLLRHAAVRGTQAQLTDALFTAYFLDGRNVSDPHVLVDVATAHGFTVAEVEQLVGDEAELALTRMEAQDAARKGVRGVPLFILNQRITLSGAQAPEVFREAIERALAWKDTNAAIDDRSAILPV